MSSSSNLPPATSNGVFCVSSKREINAPIEKVWDVLTDLPKYREWNPFVREMLIVDESKKVVPDQALAEGRYLLMKCHIPPDAKSQQKAFELVKTVDTENYRLSWLNVDYPRWLLHAQRWQALSSVDRKTLYETREVFSGILAYVVNWFLGKSLRRSFDAFADGLKERSEQSA